MGEAVRCGQGFREAPVMVWVCILLVLNQHSKASIQCCSAVAPYVYLEEENTLFAGSLNPMKQLLAQEGCCHVTLTSLCPKIIPGQDLCPTCDKCPNPRLSYRAAFFFLGSCRSHGEDGAPRGPRTHRHPWHPHSCPLEEFPRGLAELHGENCRRASGWALRYPSMGFCFVFCPF